MLLSAQGEVAASAAYTIPITRIAFIHIQSILVFFFWGGLCFRSLQSSVWDFLVKACCNTRLIFFQKWCSLLRTSPERESVFLGAERSVKLLFSEVLGVASEQNHISHITSIFNNILFTGRL